MSKQYYQCRMERQVTPDTLVVTTGWIEAKAAKVGAKVELLPSKEFWTVAEVFGIEMPEEMLKEHQRMHRNSLPSVKPSVKGLGG